MLRITNMVDIQGINVVFVGNFEGMKTKKLTFELHACPLG